MEDNRQVMLFEDNSQHTTYVADRRKRLGFFGIVGLMFWLVVLFLIVCMVIGRNAHGQPMRWWLVSCEQAASCTTVGSAAHASRFACDQELVRLSRMVRSGTRLYCDPAIAQATPLPSPTNNSRSTLTCRWIGVNWTCD